LLPKATYLPIVPTIEQRHPEDWSWKNVKSTDFIIEYDIFIWQRIQRLNVERKIP
jgi:hypothetical protein